MHSVLLLGPSLSAVSGVSTHLNQLIDSSLGREFRLIHFQVGSEGRKEHPFGKFVRLVWSPLALAGRLITLRPDVVHLNTSIDAKAFWRDAAYLVIAKLLGRKIVYQVHGGALPGVFFGTHGTLNRFARWLFRLPDAVILLAEVELRAYESFSCYKYLSLLPNAIDLSLYGGAQQKAFDSEVLQLGYIGRLAESKGILEVIEALHILQQRGLNRLHFTIAGSGPADAAIRERIRARGLESKISLTGPVFGEEKVQFWHKTDIFVFPTHREGMPYVVLESLASGTPMVTTRVGGIPDAVTDGVHGFLIAPGDPGAIADRLQRMALDRGLLQRMSAACTHRAREQYSVERLARQLSELYKMVLG